MECQIHGENLEITTMKIAQIHGSLLNALVLRRMKSRMKKEKEEEEVKRKGIN